MDALWRGVDVVRCITLASRPERRAHAEAEFARVGLADRVAFAVEQPDAEDGKRGCFCAHQRVAREALAAGARTALVFEDDVEFLPTFSDKLASRAARFLRDPPDEWQLLFLGHAPRAMALVDHDLVRVRSLEAHAYVLSRAGMHALDALEYDGRQVDVHFHYGCEHAFAIYPMFAVQRPFWSDTERLVRTDVRSSRRAREAELYDACVRRSTISRAEALLAGIVGGTSSSASHGPSV